jgi:hypothetical protein
MCLAHDRAASCILTGYALVYHTKVNDFEGLENELCENWQGCYQRRKRVFGKLDEEFKNEVVE